MQIIAHRGASHDAPENTLSAVRLAWEQDADGIEIDVHLTRDGHVVLLHDATTERTSAVTEPILDLTREQAHRVDVGNWKGSTWKGEGIPGLDTVLATVPPGKTVFIEIKCGAAVIGPLRDVVQASGLPSEQIVLVGEFTEVMGPAKEVFPRHDVYWIVNLKKHAARSDDPSLPLDLVAEVQRAGLDGLGLRCVDFLDAPFVQVLKEAGQKLFVWTVDDPADAERMRCVGADSLATNRPGYLRARLGGGST